MFDGVYSDHVESNKIQEDSKNIEEFFTTAWEDNDKILDVRLKLKKSNKTKFIKLHSDAFLKLMLRVLLRFHKNTWDNFRSEFNRASKTQYFLHESLIYLNRALNILMRRRATSKPNSRQYEIMIALYRGIDFRIQSKNRIEYLRTNFHRAIDLAKENKLSITL